MPSFSRAKKKKSSRRSESSESSKGSKKPRAVGGRPKAPSRDAGARSKAPSRSAEGDDKPRRTRSASGSDRPRRVDTTDRPRRSVEGSDRPRSRTRAPARGADGKPKSVRWKTREEYGRPDTRVDTRGTAGRSNYDDKPKPPHVYAETLTSAQRAKLKGLAHALKPFVKVGGAGLSRSVLGEIEQALDAHELIKIQLPGQTAADDKKAVLNELEPLLPSHSHIVGRIGRIVVLFKEKKPSEAKIKLKGL